MKKLILTLCLLAGTAFGSYAQMAKVQFMDAEEQYAAGKYEEAIELLYEAEYSNKKGNPMISHLRIMAKHALLKNGYNEYDYKRTRYILDAKTEAEIFLKEQEGKTELEDKYVDVYKALKDLKVYAAAIPKPQKPTAEVIEDNIAFAKAVIPKYKDGLTFNEAKQLLPQYKQTEYKNKNITFWGPNSSINIRFSESGLTNQYTIFFNIPDENQPTCEQHNQLVSSIKQVIASALGSGATTSTTPSGLFQYTTKERTFDLSDRCEFAEGEHHQLINFSANKNASIK